MGTYGIGERKMVSTKRFWLLILGFASMTGTFFVVGLFLFLLASQLWPVGFVSWFCSFLSYWGGSQIARDYWGDRKLTEGRGRT